MPALSIIIPVYNVENYLKKCLDSFISEKLSDYEIILVNDGSTDSSPEICQEYSGNYPDFIRYVSKENGGLGSARNRGLEEASGEYILFLDSDDYLNKNALEEMLSLIKSGRDVYIFDLVAINESGKGMGYMKGCDSAADFSFEEHPELLFALPNACNKIWKRSLFSETDIRFPDRLWFEDLYTIPKLYLHAKSFSYAPYGWYMYLQRTGSITRSSNLDRNLEIIDAVESVTSYYKERGVFDKFKNELEYMALYNQVITSTTRVNLQDKRSPVQHKLFNSFKNQFPDYRDNPYVRSMPKKLKLLMFYIEHRMYGAFNFTMSLNELIKDKK